MVGALDAVVRSWERIAGPGAGVAENIGSIGWGLAGAMLAPRLGRPHEPRRADDAVATAVLRVVALDLWGGAWCNNTPAAVRWYHREGHGPRQRLAFCAAHLHPFVLAWLDGERDGTRWRRAGIEYAYLVAAVGVVERVGPRSRRVVGLLATVGGALLDRALGPSRAAPWFAPVFFTKLLAGHAAGGALLPRRRPGLGLGAG